MDKSRVLGHGLLLLFGLLLSGCANTSVQATLPTLPVTVPSTPTTTPSTPAMSPSVPTVAPSVPTVTPSIPVVTPSIPAVTPTLNSICTHPAASGLLPNLDRLRAQNQTIRIVALGSSSTAGQGASQPGNGYVEQLQLKLRAAWGTTFVTVLNKGVGGNTLKDMIARLDTDVYAQTPDLVILQTGVNDALQQVNQATFQAQLSSVLDDFRKHNLDVLMVGGQYLPSPPNSYDAYMIIMQTAAVARSMPYVSRQQLASDLFSIGYTTKDIVASDNLHPNDLMHACTASAIAAVFNHSN